MTRPRAVSLSSTSSDDVRELSSEEIARLSSRPGRPRTRQRTTRNLPIDAEIIVISDSESPIRHPPSFQARLTRSNEARREVYDYTNSPNASISDRHIRQQERWRRLQEQSAELASRQEQLLESFPFVAAVFGSRPVIRRQVNRTRRSMPYGPRPFVQARPMAVHRFLLMPHVNDAFDAMSYDELLELGRRVGEVRPRGADSKKIACLRKRKWKGLKATLPTSSDAHGCAICIEDFVDTDDVRTLQCKHMFHAACSEKWLKVNATCPVCRASIDGTRATS